MKKEVLDKITWKALKGTYDHGIFLYDIIDVRCTKRVRVVHLDLRRKIMVLHFYCTMNSLLADFQMTPITNETISTPPVTCSLTTSRVCFMFFDFTFPCYPQVSLDEHLFRCCTSILHCTFLRPDYYRTAYSDLIEKNILCQFKTAKRVYAKEQQDRVRQHRIDLDYE